MKAAIVLDPIYPGLEQMADQMPVWAIDSVAHRATAERMWQLQGTSNAFRGITLFKVKDAGDAEDNCINVIGNVDLHHGVYSSGERISMLIVVGALPSNRVIDELKLYDFETFEMTPDGFVAK
ncbi:hypothetical protein [Edaphobacter bradus]|uniref:hypothetical protein n=1 Tax=Edaphobacter bradus TaxID=2259016 RepID=UPI0021E02259|nr:hypothetical protein [Edaphobacter bradus]